MQFYLQNYEETIDWCARIKDLPNTSHLSEELTAILIFNMLSHYELGNYELIEYLVKQALRFMDKKENSNSFKRTLLNFIKSQLNNPAVDPEEFEKCKRKLIKIQAQTTATLLPNFDIITWLDSKIEGKTFLECSRQKL